MSEMPLLDRDRSLFIDGAWRSPAAPQPINVVDPSTGAPLTRSGIGRELGAWGLYRYLGVKHIATRAIGAA